MNRTLMSIAFLLIAVPLVAQAKVSGNVVVTVTATDAGCGIKQVQLFLGTTPLGPVMTTAPYTYTWNTTLSPDAIYDLKATAQDKSGGPTPLPGQECNGSQPNSATAPKQVEVDNLPADTTPPTVNIVTPVAGAIVTGKINVTASTNEPSNIQLFIGGVLRGSATDAEGMTVNWNTNPQKGNVVELRANATDVSGNGPTTTTINVMVKR